MMLTEEEAKTKWCPVETLDWNYSDSYDGCCGRPCTPTGCHESHETGIYVIHGPDYDTESLSVYGMCTRNEGHAALIAAAPKLYAALKDFFDNPLFQVAVCGNPIRVQQMLANARAALKEAVGGLTREDGK